MECTIARIETKEKVYYIIAEVKNGRKYNAIFNATPRKSYKKL